MLNAAFGFVFLGILSSAVLAYEVSAGHKPLFETASRSSAAQPVRFVKTGAIAPKPFNFFDAPKDKSSKNRSAQNNRNSRI